MADQLSSAPRRLLGLSMIAIVVALLGLCVAVYNKTFTPVVPVTMRIAQSDNSLLPNAEVRVRGVTVGEVTSISTDGKDATINLALQPDQAAHIPSNVTGRLLPKSLFGERFVALVPPAQPAPTPVKAGDVIPRDRSSNAIETEQIFNNLLPLIQAVRPADLASTLGALNQALTGRGAQLGDTITLLHRYLSQFNPALPDLTADIRALPQFTDTYSTAAPDLIEGLKDLTTTTRTLDEKRDELSTLLDTATDASNDLRRFLDENRDNLINLVHAARPPLELLARYSPEYVCLFTRLAAAVPLARPIFGQGDARPALHVTVEIVANRGPYRPHQDEPEFTDNRGPACYNNTPPVQQYPGGPYQDGSTHPPASPRTFQLGKALGSDPVTSSHGPGDTSSRPSAGTGSGGSGQPGLPLLGGGSPAPGSTPSDSTSSGSTSSGSGGSRSGQSSSGGGGGPLGGLLGMPAPDQGAGGAPRAMAGPVPAFTASTLSVANSPAERDLVSGLVADMVGADRGEVPAWSSLLVGPLLRGVEVQVR
jgi:phospholipid/cholesterol/gamma-HCH transport system substrate-binding protein